MKFIRLILCLLLLSSTLALAQDGNWGERRRGGWGGGFRGRYESVTDEELAELATFMKEASPKRWEIYENLPETSLVRERARSLFLSRYRMLMRTKTEDPVLYDTLVERVKLEDVIFDVVANINKATSANAPASDVEALRTQFKAKVTALVDLGVKERKHRIERMERTLQSERQKLRQDEQNKESVVAERMKRFEQGAEWQPPGTRENQPMPSQMNIRSIPEPAPR